MTVLSIVAREGHDDLEPVTYYDQPVFARHRPTPREDGTTGDGTRTAPSWWVARRRARELDEIAGVGLGED